MKLTPLQEKQLKKYLENMHFANNIVNYCFPIKKFKMNVKLQILVPAKNLKILKNLVRF